MKKTLYLLNIDNYAPDITALTYPLIEKWARKIGAEIHIIDQRKFPGWEIDYEKLQIHELSRQRGDDWSIYIDSDAVVHPDLPDITELLPRDTVSHHGSDFAPVRWRYDDYFRRDGRHIGSCTWLVVNSSWCNDLWQPLEGMTMADAVKNITPIAKELNTVITPEHLVADYALSRNIARYGLKFTTLMALWEKHSIPGSQFFYHEYTITKEEKVVKIADTIKQWGL